MFRHIFHQQTEKNMSKYLWILKMFQTVFPLMLFRYKVQTRIWIIYSFY